MMIKMFKVNRCEEKANGLCVCVCVILSDLRQVTIDCHALPND
jgi:hypothetical protein